MAPWPTINDTDDEEEDVGRVAFVSAVTAAMYSRDQFEGCKENWQDLSEKIANSTGRNVYAVDLRNHGDSPHTRDMDYPLMVADLEMFLRERDLDRVALVGHSMGGRTAMLLALSKPSLVDRLTVIDIGPSTMPVLTGNVPLPQQLDGMDAVLQRLTPNLSFQQARRQADRILASLLISPKGRAFLLANLRERGGMYEWRVNVKSIRENLSELVRAESLSGRSSDVEALFICGSKSPYVSTEERENILRTFPKARIVTVEGAGHWVHNDKPAVFVEMVTAFMAKTTR
ncbi:sn-1-specific diacylglycerol lipase ABHD11-like [Haemaphysalis longicornis]